MAQIEEEAARIVDGSEHWESIDSQMRAVAIYLCAMNIIATRFPDPATWPALLKNAGFRSQSLERRFPAAVTDPFECSPFPTAGHDEPEWDRDRCTAEGACALARTYQGVLRQEPGRKRA